MLSLCLFVFLVSPFGLRTYLDASAAHRLAAAQALREVDRPANGAAHASASNVRPFARPVPSALDGVRARGRGS